MSHSMTYATLKEDIETYCERHDDPFLTQIPRFIALAEHRIAAEVHGLGYLRFVTDNLVQGDPVIAKPARWRETTSFTIGTGTGSNTRVVLFNRTYEYIRTFWPDSTQEEQPRYYGDYDYQHFIVAPTPSSAYPFELVYHEMPEPLSDDNQTNWTTEYAPQLLIYASLLETAPFLKNDERMAVWTNMYGQAKAAIEQESARRFGDRSTAPR